MADTPPEPDDDRSSDTSKLELPSLRLPRLGRRKQRTADADPAPLADSHADPAPSADPEADPATSADSQAGGEAAIHARSDPHADPAPLADPHADGEAAIHAGSADIGSPNTPGGTGEAAIHAGSADPAPVADDAEDEPVRRRRRLPTPPGWVAAVLTGVVVGLLGAALTVGSLRGCDAVRGTESCGGGPGLLLLVVILALMVVLGALLLTLMRQTNARAASFLGVGVLAVVVLLTPQDQLFSAWMFLVVPVLAAAGYLLAHWVTTAFVEPRPERGPEHDVR